MPSPFGESGAKLVGGRLRLRRPSSRPAIVCASSAPPRTGPATTSVGANDVVRQDVDQILPEPPDQRRLPEDPVRIQIDAAVVAVAVVEVPVEHEHFELLKVRERLLAQIVSTRHSHLGARPTLSSSLEPQPSCRALHATRICVHMTRPGRRRSSRRRRPSASSRRTACSSTSTEAPRRATVTEASGARIVRSAGPPSGACRRAGRARAPDPDVSSSTSRGEADHAGVHQPIEAERHRGLEADDAERRAVELERLLVGVMRRVVGGDDVDRSVAQALDHRQPIGLLAQRRIHLEVRVVAAALASAPRRSARSDAASPRP